MNRSQYSLRRRRGNRAQAMVEFAFVIPVFLALALGSLIVYTWQLDIDSAQFAAEEGIQSAALPSSATSTTGLLCDAGDRAYQALTTKSFISATTLLRSGGSCAAGQPDYSTSCPGAKPTYSSMVNFLGTVATSSQKNVVMICVSCVDISTGAANCTSAHATDQAQLTVTIAGYKPLPVGVPFIGSRIPYYGQNSQTVQEFQ